LIAVCVNLLNRSGTANSLLLGGAWLATAFVIPGMTPVLAEALSPTPSRALYLDLARAARLEFYNAAPDERGRELQRQTRLAAFLERHPEWASDPSLHRQALYQAAQGEDFSLKVGAITREFDTARRRQDTVSAWISVLSLTATTDQILTGLSGNSDARQAAFLEQSMSFFARSKRYFWPRIFRQELFRPAQFAEIPRFTFVEPDAAAVFRPLWLLCAALVSWCAAGSLVARRQLGRKPVL
jgi:hypothetical protein